MKCRHWKQEMKSHDFVWTHSCDGRQLLTLVFTAVMCKSWQTLSVHSICTNFVLQLQSQVNIISQQWISPSSWHQLLSRAFSGWMLQSWVWPLSWSFFPTWLQYQALSGFPCTAEINFCFPWSHHRICICGQGCLAGGFCSKGRGCQHRLCQPQHTAKSLAMCVMQKKVFSPPSLVLWGS